MLRIGDRVWMVRGAIGGVKAEGRNETEQADESSSGLGRIGPLLTFNVSSVADDIIKVRIDHFKVSTPALHSSNPVHPAKNPAPRV